MEDEEEEEKEEHESQGCQKGKEGKHGMKKTKMVVNAKGKAAISMKNSHFKKSGGSGKAKGMLKK